MTKNNCDNKIIIIFFENDKIGACTMILFTSNFKNGMEPE